MYRLPYYLVELSPWPITLSISIIFIALGIINWLHFYSINILLISSLLTFISIYQWWRDMVREATYMGNHSSYVQSNLRLGMVLFIISEICFFFTFFWTFFHISLSPSIELGHVWPPTGINPINPISIPLLNTVTLLVSGLTVTWAHHSLIMGKNNNTIFSLLLTIILGLYFIILQATEYYETSFTIADSVYGSTFFIITGFHGIHVTIGALFLLVNLLRTINIHFSTTHHLGLEIASWYWHFVDVVWILLYACIYWWGSL